MRSAEAKREYSRKYYAEHKEELSRKRKEKYASDPDYRERLKRYDAEHREEIRARKKRYYMEVIKPRECRDLF